MTQTTILTVGVTAGMSSNITIAAGEVATIGIFCDSLSDLPLGVVFAVLQDTPGADNVVSGLHQANRTVVLSGPGTFRVSRPNYSGPKFGVFLEN